MTEVKYRMKIPEELLPMTFGSPLRNPHYDWASWGIGYDAKSFHQLNDEAEQAYSDEWSKASGKITTVAEAAKKAGFGDNAQIVRDAAAAVVPYLVSGRKGRVKVFFHGTGQGIDAKTVFSALDENDKDRVYFTLLDPGKTEIEKAEANMKELGVDHLAIHAYDTEIPEVLPESQDIFIGVASMHHHALIPWNIYRDAMTQDGALVVSDWHVNNLWTPEGIYVMLSNMKWDKKGECLDAWRKAYKLGQTNGDALAKTSLSPADTDMIRFWAGYHELWRETREPGEGTAIWPNEGHRSKERYMTEMAQAGFKLWDPEIEKVLHEGFEVNGRKIETNPHQILDSSELLMLTLAKK